MPFVALRASTQERINIFSVEDPRTEIKKGELVCPLCHQPMTVVAGLVRMKHFRHLVECSSDVLRHPESSQHLSGKAFVANILQKAHPNESIEFEVVIPEINRVADVLVSFRTGWKEVHEIQLASITTGELLERTLSYRKAGIDVVWWLGNQANTDKNQSWILDKFGDVRVLEFERDSTGDQA